MDIVAIKKLTEENNNFRKVLFTGKHSQIVAMTLDVGEEIGEEIHDETDQLFIIIDGECLAIVDDKESYLEDEEILIVPSGMKHNIKNNGDEELKLVTVYSPPHHPDGTIHKTKKDAEEEEYG